MRKPPVVGNRQRLEEEVRKAPRRPRLDVGVLGVESIATGILALVEELQSFNTQSATIFDSKREHCVRANITKHVKLANLALSAAAAAARGMADEASMMLSVTKRDQVVVFFSSHHHSPSHKICHNPPPFS